MICYQVARFFVIFKYETKITNMSKRAKRLFLVFAYLTLILVVAAFASIVASTFGATFDEAGVLDVAASASNASVAMVSLLLPLIAMVFTH